MRFLDTNTGAFVERDPKETKYAILSHTWGQHEQTYTELREIQKRYPPSGQHLEPGARGPQCLLSSCPHATLSSSVSSHPFSDANKGSSSPHDPTSSTGQNAFAGGQFTSTNAEEQRLDRPLRELWPFSLLIFALLGYFHISPSPGSPGAALTSRDSRMPRPSIWDDRDLSPKIREACRVAREAGYDYLWIDSCCIDKTSSSELSEAINSMYLWYGIAKECYAYLADVPPGEDPRSADSRFRLSRWFTRGWTLQELISPHRLQFLSKDWEVIGTKATLVDLVEEITTVPREALLHLESLDDFSVAQRLSWAAARETTRVEDRAYSLLGIFDINIPTLYGEGERAFRRLQEEIVRRVPDQSLFAWKRLYTDIGQGQDLVQCPSLQNATKLVCVEERQRLSLFSSDLEPFSEGGRIRVVSHDDILHRLRLSDFAPTQYTFTTHGIQTQLPLIPVAHCLPRSMVEYDPNDAARWYLAILGCEHEDHPGALLGRVVYVPPSKSGVEYLHCGYMHVAPLPTRGDRIYWPELFPLWPATLERCRAHIELKTVYLSHPERARTQPASARRQPHETIDLMLRRKTRDALLAQGYTADLRRPDEGRPTTHHLTLSSDDYIITIEYQHRLEDDGLRLTVEALVKASRSALESVRRIEADPEAVSWSDHALWGFWWNESLDIKEVAFTLAPKELTVRLGLIWAAPSHYFTCVDIVTGGEADEHDIMAKSVGSEGGALANHDEALLVTLDPNSTVERLEA
ncbi:HET-domain-containing protein [Dichomitus squalens]|uniref:HET-domain-containing protein n=1 Tax=Dichomitus squalens TaxID=114155 RepID=A0A4Q9MJQ8_9APHY|nr:HET-domain-containing protein [Dichomitus squalens]